MTATQIEALRPGQSVHVRIGGRCRLMQVAVYPVHPQPGDPREVWASSAYFTAKLTHHSDAHLPKDCGR